VKKLAFLHSYSYQYIIINPTESSLSKINDQISQPLKFYCLKGKYDSNITSYWKFFRGYLFC